MSLKPAFPAEEIVLFRPVYTETGSCTELVLKNGFTNHDNRSVDSIRSALARSYAIDLVAQARMIAQIFHRSPPLPFFLPDAGHLAGGRVFVPLKMRRPRVPRDRAYGYVDINCINRVDPCGPASLLHLSMGIAIELICTPQTARAAIYLGREIADRYLKFSPSDEDQVIQTARILLSRLENIEQYLEKLAR